VGTSDLEQSWEGRPRLTGWTLGWRLLADCKSGNAEGTLAGCGTDAVCTGVSTTEDDDVLALSGDLTVDAVASNRRRLRGLGWIGRAEWWHRLLLQQRRSGYVGLPR
jgi:hypothetical protein